MKSLQILPVEIVLKLLLSLAVVASTAWAQTVATPTFLPVEGESLTRFPVVVICSTSGATIRYTVTGAEPTPFDPVVVSGGTIDLPRNMTLMAKAWSGGESSATATTTFEITGDLAAGSQNILALVTNGQVMGWGNQDFGRLANGSTATTNILAPAPAKYSSSSSIGNAFRIAAGAKHSLMLDSSGNVWGFGNNLLGESGRSTPSELLYATQVTKSSTITDYLTDCTKISAGLDFSAALESAGFVRTWGSQVSGRLANGSTATGSRKFAGRAKSTSSVELSGIRDIALGKDFALAREANALELGGSLGKVWVWGNNASANLGIGNTTAQAYAVKAKLNATTDLMDVWDMDAGDGHSVVVRWKTGDSNLQGSVWTFGSRVNGRLGDNAAITGTASYPVQVQKLVGSVYSPLTGISQVSAGPAHTLALDNLGNVWAWGANATGALGDNTTVDKKYAVKVRNPANNGDLTNIVRVCAGGINGSPAFSSAVASDGTIYFWGSNQYGVRAATASTTAVKLPVVISQLKTIPGFPTVSLAVSVTTSNAPGAATITAAVADPQGAANIQKTEFFVAGVLNTTRTAAPWTASLASLSEGTYHVYAKTTDVDGNVTTSLPVTFTIETSLDSDGDGLLDSWEIQQFGNLNQNGGGDPDNDKINNLREFETGTNPNSNADGNADGLPDDWVVWHLAQATGAPATSLPADGDPDQDELTNLVEYQNNTYPRLLDSDDDTQSDWQEIAQGTDPNDLNSLAAPFAVSAHKGTSNLQVPMTLPNLAPSNSYVLALSDNFPSTTGFEMTSSNISGGPAYEWIDISTTGEHLTDFETDASAMVERTIGFSFPFYGTSYSSVFISGQGFATLTDPGSWYPGDPMEFRAPLPNVDGHRPLISPYQQYMEPDVQGEIYFKAFPGYVVIQWEQVKVYGFDTRPTFQAVLYADGTIRFNYKSIPLSSGGFWISGYLSGVQNAAGDAGIGASWYTSSQQGLAIHKLAPLSLRFGSPPASGGPWVTASSTALSGDPLNWGLNFQPSELQPGNHDAVLEFRKNVSSPVLYRRIIRLNVLPLGTSGNDVMNGTSGDDSLSGLGGNDTLHGNDGNDTLNGHEGNDIVNGNDGNDTLNGNDGDDTLNGNAGNDTLDGGSGDDTISGNTGDDSLTGGSGKDVYHYALGDGNDTYTDTAGIHQADDATADYSDLYFGAGITPVMLRSRYNNSLGTLKFEVQDEAGGSITITSWNIYSGSTGVTSSRRWRFHFQDGTVWGGQLFWNEGVSWPFQGFTGGILNETVVGSAEEESLRGLGGDDLLQGGDGWDSYYYQWGGGNDTIQDNPGNGQLSILYIHGANLESQVTYDFVAPSHLRINISHPSDPSKNGSITLNDWYLNQPTISRDKWRIYVQNAGATLADISQQVRLMGTNGPDILSAVLIITANGQTFDAGAGNDVIAGSIWSETILGNLGNDNLSGGLGNDTLDGGDGNDSLYGEDGNDVLLGALGADSLQGGNGDDRLVGGAGDDGLQGGTGNDNYEWNLGDGNDAITDSTSETDAAIQNWLNFGPGIAPAQIDMIYVSETALKFQIRDLNNQVIGSVIVDDWYTNVGGGVNHASNWRIGFSGIPTPWDGRTLVTPGPDRITGTAGIDSLQGGTGDDILLGLDGADSLDGGPGNDVVDGGGGADVVLGSDGNDHLNGGTGDDRLVGGGGNDTLGGGAGSDVYEWNIGDGNDTITEDVTNTSLGSESELIFGSGITSGQVQVQLGGVAGIELVIRDTNGLVIGSVVINNWFAEIDGGMYHSGQWKVAFVDGSTTWLGEKLPTPGADNFEGAPESESIDAGAGNDIVSGQSGDDVISGGDGDDTIYGQNGTDTLEGGNGLDELNGGSGSDHLDGGADADSLDGGFGNDIVSGGAGADSLIGGGGNDTLSGGPGNDELYGGTGSDIYLWNLGDGEDLIEDSTEEYGLQVQNQLVFGTEISPGQLSVSFENGLDLKVVVYDQLGIQIGSIKIKGWYAPTAGGATHARNWQIVFTQGGIQWEGKSLITEGPDFIVGSAGSDDISGGDGNDEIRGTEGDDALSGDGGSDLILGGEGSDDLYGNVGSDALDGEIGDDTLHGGGGNDHLNGGPGNDVYRWSLGDGDDVIEETLSDAAIDDHNRILFGPGIGLAQVRFEDVPNSPDGVKVVIKDGDGVVNGSIIIRNWYKYVSANRKHLCQWQFEFDGGQVWNPRQSLRHVGSIADLNADSDGDGMSDAWELAYDLDPNVASDAALDLDGDGLSNAGEYAADTNPVVSDTDSDGFSDGLETTNATNPNGFDGYFGDGDHDGLEAAMEIRQGSSPASADTDGDLWNDFFEYYSNTDPIVSDSDFNGIDDIDEDWDGDGLSNRTELAATQTNPLLKDSDDDGISDSSEISLGMDPNKTEDGAGDIDGDGLTTAQELKLGYDPSDGDSDHDGLQDGLEHKVGLNALSPDSDSNGIPDLDEDLDGDSLTNAQEFSKNSYIADPDSDDDGINDNIDTTP